MRYDDYIRHYSYNECVAFKKTKDEYGGLSNMAPGFPLLINGIKIGTSEALYQACRFPHLPKVQHIIIDERSPMTAKMRSRAYLIYSRQDWALVRVNIMRWCLRVKLAQNWDKFSELLLSTGQKPIVEKCNTKDFWGAKFIDPNTLVGTNALGRLLMELREMLKNPQRITFTVVPPPIISDFLLYEKPIGVVQNTVVSLEPDNYTASKKWND